MGELFPLVVVVLLVFEEFRGGGWLPNFVYSSPTICNFLSLGISLASLNNWQLRNRTRSHMYIICIGYLQQYIRRDLTISPFDFRSNRRKLREEAIYRRVYFACERDIFIPGRRRLQI